MKSKLILLGGIMVCFAFMAAVSFAQQTRLMGTSPIRQELKVEAHEQIGGIKDETAIRMRELQAEQKKKAEENRIELDKKKEELRLGINGDKVNASASSTTRQESKDELKNKAQEARLEFDKNREEARIEMEKNRGDFKKEISDKKVEVKDIITAKRIELEKKLNIVKDEKKKEIALKVGDQFQEINTKVLASLTSILNREGEILQKVSLGADSLILRGVDASVLKEAVSLANTELAKAKDAIVVQTGKVYTITVQTEATLKNDVGATRQELQKDLESVRDLIKNVHESIKGVAEILRETPGSEKIKASSVSTSTASSTNQ